MGEGPGQTLAESRLTVETQRAAIEETAQRLRARALRAIDLPAKFRENPLLYGGLAAGAVFLAVGGPRRLLRGARHRLAPPDTLQAYHLLPKGMARWVDAMTEGAGSRRDELRGRLAEELEGWRREPMSKKRARALAREAVDGPPGPNRALWRAVETGVTLISAALARRAIERFLDGNGPVASAAELSPARGSSNGGSSRPATGGADVGYTGWSGRDRTRADAGR
jgi:hypothetical protein